MKIYSSQKFDVCNKFENISNTNEKIKNIYDKQKKLIYISIHSENAHTNIIDFIKFNDVFYRRNTNEKLIQLRYFRKDSKKMYFLIIINN
jgi:hypothetical protein